MDKQKLHLTTLSLLLMTTVVGLAALQEARLEVYVSLFAVDYFVSTALFRPRRRWHDLVGFGLFSVFSYIVAVKIFEILR